MNNETVLSSAVISELRISPATLKNWLKSGVLVESSPGKIDQNNFNFFKENILGKHRLNKRANKLFLDEENSEEISSILSSSGQSNDLSERYEESLGKSYRNAEGIYYTPEYIVSSMFDKIDLHPDMLFCDPCCGTGNFLLEAYKRGIPLDNIYGYDTDENSLEIAKKRFLTEAGNVPRNIIKKDFLLAKVENSDSKKFNVILTNPPWGKKDIENKEKFSSFFGNGKKLDSSAYFAFACLDSLKNGSYLGLLLPESFFNIKSFNSIRERILKEDLISIEDHGKPFKGLQTKARSFILKLGKNKMQNTVKCINKSRSFTLNKNLFNSLPNNIIPFDISAEESTLIDKLFSMEKNSLKGSAQWALGIVTGNNKQYIINNKKDNYIEIYKGSDILNKGFKAATSYIYDDFKRFQQVAPIEFYKSAEKVVYKFISTKLCFSNDTEQRFFLNSANMFVLKKDIGITHDQLCFLFNTKLYNWMYQKIFETHKVLRSDLEELPIFLSYFNKNQGSMDEERFYDYLKVEELKNGTFRIKK